MLPLRDDVPSRRYPVMTVTIIAVNVAAFLHELGLGRHLEAFLVVWGIVPVRYTAPEVAGLLTRPEQLLAFFTSMFLHGGWLHLFGNMWSLWIFGDNVEDRLGRLRFLSFYLLGGVAAALVHIYTNPASHVPTIGASGAIAAVVFLGWWFLLQFFNGALSLLGDPSQGAGIAWWAHIGGFVFGALLCGVMKIRRY